IVAEQRPPLSDSQKEVFNNLVFTAQAVTLTVLQGRIGSGKTTLLQHLHDQLGGRYIRASEAFDAIAMLHPNAMDEALRRLVEDALQYNDLVIFDDFGMFEDVTTVAEEANTRPYLFNVVEEALFEKACLLGKHIVVSRKSPPSFHRYFNAQEINVQGIQIEVPDLTSDDYRDF